MKFVLVLAAVAVTACTAMPSRGYNGGQEREVGDDGRALAKHPGGGTSYVGRTVWGFPRKSSVHKRSAEWDDDDNSVEDNDWDWSVEDGNDSVEDSYENGNNNNYYWVRRWKRSAKQFLPSRPFTAFRNSQDSDESDESDENEDSSEESDEDGVSSEESSEEGEESSEESSEEEDSDEVPALRRRPAAKPAPPKTSQLPRRPKAAFGLRPAAAPRRPAPRPAPRPVKVRQPEEEERGADDGGDDDKGIDGKKGVSRHPNGAKSFRGRTVFGL